MMYWDWFHCRKIETASLFGISNKWNLNGSTHLVLTSRSTLSHSIKKIKQVHFWHTVLNISGETSSWPKFHLAKRGTNHSLAIKHYTEASQEPPFPSRLYESVCSPSILISSFWYKEMLWTGKLHIKTLRHIRGLRKILGCLKEVETPFIYKLFIYYYYFLII